MDADGVFYESDATESQRSHFDKASPGTILLAPGVNRPDQSVYSVDAADFAKVLRECGARVEWATAEREYLDLKSIEVFLGTVVVPFVTSAVAGLLVEAIVRYLDGRDVRRLNVRIIESETAKTFEADGDAEQVVKALREWKRK